MLLCVSIEPMSGDGGNWEDAVGAGEDCQYLEPNERG